MFNNKRTKICLTGTLLSLAILLITFFATDGLFEDKEFSEYTSADWSIAIVPLAIMALSAVSTLTFALILVIPLFKSEPAIMNYVATQKFADINDGTEFLVFDHEELKRACCRSESENKIWFSVRAYDLKSQSWSVLEKGRYTENIETLFYILQQDYKFDELKFKY
ncbi:MAG: hypothetical protein J6Q79_09335 [Clostridia bacterium]|nr:hypothetical protein [Clostridia bacterium]